MPTQAIRHLREKKAAFEVVTYDHQKKGAEFAAQALGFPLENTIKTLVVALDSGTFRLALMPGNRRLSLKSFARACAAKRAAMADVSTAQRLTGYLVGGISPFGTRQPFEAVMDKRLVDCGEVAINGGKAGNHAGYAAGGHHRQPLVPHCRHLRIAPFPAADAPREGRPGCDPEGAFKHRDCKGLMPIAIAAFTFQKAPTPPRWSLVGSPAFSLQSIDLQPIHFRLCRMRNLGRLGNWVFFLSFNSSIPQFLNPSIALSISGLAGLGQGIPDAAHSGLHPLPGVEGTDANIPLPASAEPGSGGAHHARLVQQQIEKFPGIPFPPYPDIRRIVPPHAGKTEVGHRIANQSGIPQVAVDERSGLCLALLTVNGLRRSLDRIGGHR